MALNQRMTTTLFAALLMISVSTFVHSHPICLDSTAPFARAGASFSKCPQYNGRSTCLAPADEAASVVEPVYPAGTPGPPSTCVERFRSIACGVVDEWAGHLFRAEGPGVALAAPKLCPAYCTSLYADCAQVQMRNSPFVNDASSFTTIAAVYPTSAEFCNTFAEQDYCYAGVPYTVPPPQPFNSSLTLCTERVVSGGQPKANMQPVPGHADLMMIGDLEGLVKLYRVNDAESSTAFVEHSTLLDIRTLVRFGGEMGLLGVALHKNFFTNGRVYVSFSCRGSVAGCNSGDSIIDEYRVVQPGNRAALIADLSTRRRIFRVSQPFDNHNGGQILFSPDPSEPHLFLMMGDGGSGGDPGNRAQPLNNVYGKVLRIDVDSTFAAGGLGGVPSDNPFVSVSGANGLIWANGLRNPWRCSFDRRTYLLFCGDVGQNQIEEVDIISKGSNYGWSRYEGPANYNTGISLQGRTTHTLPIMSYTHSQMGGWGSITGGYVVRSDRDDRLLGKYVFADLSRALLLGEESPIGSGQWAWGRIQARCSAQSPISCMSIGSVYSFGEMPWGDLLIADDSGSVFRVIEPSKCNLATPSPVNAPTRSPSTSRPSRSPSTTRPSRGPTVRTKSPSRGPTIRTNAPSRGPTVRTRSPSKSPSVGVVRPPCRSLRPRQCVRRPDCVLRRGQCRFRN